MATQVAAASAAAPATVQSQPQQAIPQSAPLQMPSKPPLASVSDWSLEEDNIFESTLAEWWNAPDRLERAAKRLPTRTLDQIKLRFTLLETDVANIESGRIPLPNYASAQEHTSMERRKGIPWTEEEHRLFLMGLAKFGKGDWRSISRNYVISRTPTQVASHAQKYFIRLNSLNKKDKRRSSIHDITSPAGAGLAQQGGHHPQGQHGQSVAMVGGLAPGMALPHRPMGNMAAVRPGMPLLQPHPQQPSMPAQHPGMPMQSQVPQ